MYRVIICLLFLASNSIAIDFQWDCWMNRNRSNRFLNVIEKRGGGYLVVGRRVEVIITNLDEDRNELSVSSFCTEESADKVVKVFEDISGNFVVLGNYVPREGLINSDPFLYKFNADGDSIRYFRQESVLITEVKDAIQLENGHYLLLVGRELEVNNSAMYILQEYDTDLNLIDEYLVHRPFYGMRLSGVEQLDNGNFMVVGKAMPTIGWEQVDLRMFVLLDENFNVQSSRFQGLADDIDDVYGIGSVNEEFYYVYGTHRNRKLCIILLNQDGETYNDSLYMDYEIEKMLVTPYGENDLLVYYKIDNRGENPDSLYNFHVLTHYNLQFDSLESILWHPDSLGTTQTDEVDEIIMTKDTGALMVTSNRYYRRFWIDGDYLLKIAPPDWDPETVENSQRITPTNPGMVHVYPNPFNSQITIDLESILPFNGSLLFYNTMGKKVDEACLTSPNQSQYIWQPVNLPSGTYFIQVDWKSESIFVPISFLR